MESKAGLFRGSNKELFQEWLDYQVEMIIINPFFG